MKKTISTASSVEQLANVTQSTNLSRRKFIVGSAAAAGGGLQQRSHMEMLTAKMAVRHGR